MPIYPYSFQLPPLNVQDIPNDGAPGEFLGISAGGALDWLPVATGGGDMLKSENLSGLADYAIARTNIGLGTTSTPTFANLTLTSPSLTSDAPVTISQTWNGTGSTVFKALVVNATTPGTTSSSSSLLLDLQVGGVTQASVSKSGNLTVIGNLAANGGNSFLSGTTLRIGNSNGDINLSGGSLVIPAATAFGWANTLLVRDGDNQLSLRNGTAAQAFHVYNTYTDATNYELGFLSFSSNIFNVGTHASGSGSFRKLALYGNGIDFNHAGIGLRWSINTSGHFIAAADNSYDIGATNANRPKNIYAGSNIYAAGNVGIGTTAPLAKLHITGGDGSTFFTAATIALGFGTVGNYPHFIHTRHAGVAAGNCIDFYTCDGLITGTYPTNAVHGLTIENGKVGIGTTAPGAKLQVVGNAIFGENSISTSIVNVSFGGSYGTAVAGSKANLKWDLFNDGAGNRSGIGISSGIFEFQTGSGAGFGFYPNGSTTSALHIIPSGNVGIGTTSPTSKLQVTNGDVEIETVTSGIIMKAAGTANRYRITLNAGGTDFVITAL